MRFYLTAAVAVVLLCAANLFADVEQKGASQKGDACQKGPCQKGTVCQKGPCQKVPCQKAPCQKTPCQKGAPAAPDKMADEVVPDAPPEPETP